MVRVINKTNDIIFVNDRKLSSGDKTYIDNHIFETIRVVSDLCYIELICEYGELYINNHGKFSAEIVDYIDEDAEYVVDIIDKRIKSIDKIAEV